MATLVSLPVLNHRIQPFELLFVCLVFVLTGFAFPTMVNGAESERPTRVLIISTGSRLAPGFILADRELLQALAKLPSGRIETYAENLDLVRFPSDRYQEIFKEYLAGKYAENPPDLVILVFVGNLATPAQLLPQIFPGKPIIVAGFTEEEIDPKRFGGVSGVVQRIDPNTTLKLILRLRPDTRRIVVIGGGTDIDHQVLRRVREAAEPLKERVQFEFWDNRTVADLRRAVTQLPADTVLLFGRMFRDGTGQSVISSQIAQWVSYWANVPVFVMSDASMGTGAVGGALGSIEAFSKLAGEKALLLLGGADIKSVPLEIRTDSLPTFDWRALQRWSIPENRLPPGSVVHYRPESIWSQYGEYVIGALIIIVLQAAMIADLLIQRRRRRKIESELLESRQFMALATEAGGIGLWARDMVRGEFWANDRLRSLFGFTPNEVLTVDEVLARIHADDRANIMSAIGLAQEAGAPFEIEFRIAAAGGLEQWIAARGKLLSGPRGEPVRRMGTMIDITARKKVEEELEKEHAFLRQVIDVDPNFIFAKDREGRFTLANRAVAEAYGTTVENLIGKTDAEFNPHTEEVAFFQRMDLEVIDTLQERFIPEEQITDAQGRIRWLQTVKRPIMERNGLAKQVLGASTDITARKAAEAELQRNRDELAHMTRVSTLGELAASLAHELNQPLTGILSNAQAAQRFLSLSPPDIDELKEILKDIVQDDNRASEVIQKLRALYRKDAFTFASLDLSAVINDVVQLIHSDAVLHNARIVLEAERDLPVARGDKVQLQQVVLNLLRNAIDAMKDCPVNDRVVMVRAQRDGAEFLRVAVADCGTGLPMDQLDRVFQPFYTTKQDGLGMGLSISRSIVETHGGHLWVENNRERGATFYFTVPVEAKPSDNVAGRGTNGSARA